MIAEDAGEAIVTPFLEMAAKKGFSYLNNTHDVARLHADGIEFESGASLEAEIKIIIPDWVPHQFLVELPITDERGFVLTDRRMHNPTHPEILAVGDAAAITVPKLGSLGHQQVAGIVVPAATPVSVSELAAEHRVAVQVKRLAVALVEGRPATRAALLPFPWVPDGALVRGFGWLKADLGRVCYGRIPHARAEKVFLRAGGRYSLFVIRVCLRARRGCFDVVGDRGARSAGGGSVGCGHYRFGGEHRPRGGLSGHHDHRGSRRR